MNNVSENFFDNRRKNFSEQSNYWRHNLESGFMRMVERIVFRFNVSDILGGDLGQIQHLTDVNSQIIQRKLINPALLPNAGKASEVNGFEATVPQYLLHFRNIQLDLLTGLVHLDAGFVFDGSLAKWQKIIFRGGVGSAIKRAKKARATHTGTLMVLPHSPFYFHTVIDEIPNLLLIRKVMPMCNKVVVHKLAEEWAVDLLKILCFEVEVSQESTLRVAELVAITAPRALNKKNLDLLRENLNYQPEKILIVSRSGSPRNDDNLERSLLAGIPEAELIDPSKMTTASQVKVFSQAKAIIGLHGGALTNTVWMHESGKLVEIFNHPYRTRDYELVCQEIGQKYLALEALNSSVDTLIEQVKGFIYG